MARSIYITSAEGHTGKSTIALGVLDALMRVSPRVGVFRPIARAVAERDEILELLLGFWRVGDPLRHERAAHLLSKWARTSAAGIARSGSALSAS